ncbi:MAG: hypothetical protein HY582_01165, partial [Candidatus Omnitrophica bacterium]|nr:hypothetical protein [Candidatus Omnitrophota bacterium]
IYIVGFKSAQVKEIVRRLTSVEAQVKRGSETYSVTPFSVPARADAIQIRVHDGEEIVLATVLKSSIPIKSKAQISSQAAMQQEVRVSGSLPVQAVGRKLSLAATLVVKNADTVKPIDSREGREAKKITQVLPRSELRFAPVDLDRESLRAAVEVVAERVADFVAAPGDSALGNLLIERAVAARPKTLSLDATPPSNVLGVVLRSMDKDFTRQFGLIPNRPHKVVFRDDDPATELLLQALIEIARSAGEFGDQPLFQIFVSDPTGQFNAKYEKIRSELRISKRLSPVEDAALSRIFHIQDEDFASLTNQTHGAGALVRDKSALSGLKAGIYVTVMDLSSLKIQAARELLLAVVDLTGRLAEMLSGKSVDQILRFQATYSRLLEQYGIFITVDSEGHFVGLISLDKIAELVAQYQALEEVKQSA